MILLIFIVSLLSFLWGILPFHLFFLPVSFRQTAPLPTPRSFASRYIFNICLKKGLLLSFIYILKGLLPIFLCTFICSFFSIITPSALSFLKICSAFFVFIGHILSPQIRGLGTSVGIGIFLILSPLTCLLSGLLSLLVLFFCQYFLFSSFTFFISIPLFLFLLSSPHIYLILALILSVIAVKKQKESLKKWALGKEEKFSFIKGLKK